jgi:hypothetical protein
MADDLIIKYFTEDLTEAEEQALSQILLSSAEEAWRFQRHAEAAYLHCGLPEPKRRGGQPPPGFMPGGSVFKPGLWLFLGLAAAGFLAWALWRNETTINETVTVSTTQAPSSILPAHSTGASILSGHPRGVPAKPSPTQAVLAPSGGLAKRADPVLSPPPPTPTLGSAPLPAALPAVTPVDALRQPHRSHSNLEVLVRRATPGQIEVRVLNPDGTQAVLLYQGLLQAGSWIFDWNGHLADGRPADPGTYQIQVESGPITQSKRVVIRKK